MLVAGAAIFALDASAASAQDTTRTRPRSTTRIPVTKESPGEIAPPRVDSVMVYRTDTLRLPGRTDTVVTTNTITRVDTVSIPLPPILQIGGFYFGLDGGSSLPAANFNDSDHPGWRFDGMVGIDPLGSWFGARLTGGYANFSPHSYVERVLDNAQVWNVGLDAKFRLIKIQPFSKRVQVYGIAGGTWNHYKDVLENDHGILSVGHSLGGNQVLPLLIDHDWHSGWGYNVGGGAELGWGRTNLFVESRWSKFNGERTGISSVPVVIGLSWF